MAKASRRPAKPGGGAIHLGLNAVDPRHYHGWSGDLVACEFDAKDMAALGRSAGMRSTLLLTKKATLLRARRTDLRLSGQPDVPGRRSHGAFTEQLLRVWDDGSFKGNYVLLHAAIEARMPRTQVPNLFTLGRAGKFLAARPFTV